MENNNKSMQIYAKLLSTSDITLDYSQTADTAYYEFNNKRIVLPILSWADVEVQQLMTSHEVGHYYNMNSIGDTTEIFKKYGHDLVNILEDVYIEKWLKNNYNGLNIIFDSGYKTIFKEKFFGVSNVDRVNKMSFLDRLNIYFKCRNILNKKIIFSAEETYFVGKIHCMTNREDFFSILEELYCYLLKNKENQSVKTNKFVDLSKKESNSNSYSENSVSGKQNYSNSEEEIDEDDYEKQSLKKENSENNNIHYGEEFYSETQNNFDNNVKNNINKYISKKSVSFYIDTKDNVFYKNKISDIENIRENINKNLEKNGYWGIISSTNKKNEYCVTRNNYDDFNKIIKKMAISGNTFFNQYKSAKKLREKKYKNTGTIDRNELATYKTSTDIFKRKVISNKEQSHAVVIAIDLSNSIKSGINTIIAQTSILAEFCKYNKIKFKIFGFGLFLKKKIKDNKNSLLDADDTSSPILLVDDEHWKTDSLSWLAFKTKVSKINIDDNLSYTWDFYDTPINKALFSCYNALENYKLNGYQKVSLFVITDGSSYNDEIKLYNSKDKGKYSYNTTEDIRIGYSKLNNSSYSIFIDNEKENYKFKIIEEDEYNKCVSSGNGKRFYLLDSIFPASIFSKMKNKLNVDIYFSYITQHYYRKTYTPEIPYIHEIEYLTHSNFVYYDNNNYEKAFFCDCYDVKENSFAKKLFISDYMNILDKDYLKIYKKYSNILKKFVTEIAKDIA